MSRPAPGGSTAPGTTETAAATPDATAGRTALTVVAWAWVGVPFLYGVVSLMTRIPALFST